MGKQYTAKQRKDLCEAILKRVAGGESLRSVCADEDMPALTTANDWLHSEEYGEHYARAREQRAEAMFEEILAISDDGSNDYIVDPETGLERLNSEHVQRSRLRVDSRKWMLGKMQPKTYGDKLDVEHKGAVNVVIAPEHDGI